jgi:hypothetical protein
MEPTGASGWRTGVPDGQRWWLTDWVHYGFYSLDVFLPIVDLGQAAAWVPQRTSTTGFWLTVWVWVEALFGWGLVTILAGALAGLSRRE